MAGVQSPVPPLQPLQPLRGRALAQGEVQDMSNEKFISGGLWAGCRTRLGVMHQTMVVKKVSWKLRLPFSFTFFDKKCFGVHSLESIPPFWSGALVPWVWCEVSVLSLCPRVGYPQKRGNSKTCIMGAKRTREIFRAKVFKDFPLVKFSIRWGISGRTYSTFCCTCFVFFKLMSLT